MVGKPHRYVIDLMHGAARNGQVNLVIRRRVQAGGEKTGMESANLYFLLLNYRSDKTRHLNRNLGLLV